MPTDVKELRVRIDMSYHLKLHALKLLKNKKMSDAVEEALDRYFTDVAPIDQPLGGAVEPSPRQGPPSAPAEPSAPAPATPYGPKQPSSDEDAAPPAASRLPDAPREPALDAS
ncbi:MAG: hypothetical protein ACYDDF_04855 [Thermoplasmatota archaeon]